jgi:hypothetical protein
MFLETIADRTSDRVWRLDRNRILRAVEEGQPIGAIAAFLESHSSEPVPAGVQTFLADLGERAGRLSDKGSMRMIECDSEETARLLVADSKLKSLCLLAGERGVVFRASDESTVRGRLRKLGYVLASAQES